MGIWREVSTSDDESADYVEELTPIQQAYIHCEEEFSKNVDFDAWLDRWHGPFGYASDCSGMDAPLMALRKLFKDKAHLVKYMSCSEKDKVAMDFLVTNHGEPLQCCKDVHDVDAQRHHRKVAFYSSGFPCTPYSWLHCDTQLLAEPDALPMWQSICNFKLAAPAAGLFENVRGFERVMDEVLPVLRANLPEYSLEFMEINPSNYGAPISRDRLFFVLVRSDLMINAARRDFCKYVHEMSRRFEMDCTLDWQDLLLPEDHWRVEQSVRERTQRSAKTRKNKSKKDPKWKDLHKQWAQQHKVIRSRGCFKQKFPKAAKQITSKREIDALDKITKQLDGDFEGCNTSQSLGRMSVVTNRQPLMCITPSASILAVQQQRFITGLESMILMGMPVDSLLLNKYRDRVLQKLAGNSMAMRALYVAMLTALRALNPCKLREYLV